LVKQAVAVVLHRRRVPCRQPNIRPQASGHLVYRQAVHETLAENHLNRVLAGVRDLPDGIRDDGVHGIRRKRIGAIKRQLDPDAPGKLGDHELTSPDGDTHDGVEHRWRQEFLDPLPQFSRGRMGAMRQVIDRARRELAPECIKRLEKRFPESRGEPIGDSQDISVRGLLNRDHNPAA
jgi:hypothetical protein